jgi:hypothetical protein
MSEWISVYCRRPIALDAAAMRRALDDADVWTLAEALDVAEDELDTAVESMSHNLRVAPAPDGTCVEVGWKPQGRPIRISSVTGAEAGEQIAETLEELPPATGPGPARVRDHLGQCRQVVNLEMGAEDARHLGATLGQVLAFHVAGAGEGLVCFFDQEWASPENRTLWRVLPDPDLA